MFKNIEFQDIFQLIVLIALVVYVFWAKDVENTKLIIGAFIGVLSNVPKRQITNDKL